MKTQATFSLIIFSVYSSSKGRLGEGDFWQFRMTRFYQCTLFPGNPLESRFILARKKRALRKPTLEPQVEGV
jgi:hypothetical protein